MIETSVMKDVRIDRICTDVPTSARRSLDEETIKKYMELYSLEDRGELDERLPPVSLEVIQTGDPRTTEYLVLDGRHRIESRRRMGTKTIPAEIGTKLCLTKESLTEFEAQNNILQRQVSANRRHGLPFTKEDIRLQVEQFIKFGLPKSKICDLVGIGRTTLYEWYPGISRDRTDIREKYDALAVSLDQPLSSRRAAQILGVSKSTINNYRNRGLPEKRFAGNDGQIVRNEHDGQPYEGRLDVPTSRSVGDQAGNLDRDPQVGGNPEAESDRDSAAEVNRVYDILNDLSMTDTVEHELVFSILELLCRKSPKVREIVREGGYATKLEQTLQSLNSLRRELSEKNKELFENRQRTAELELKLKERTDHCSSGCAFSSERLKAEADKFISAFFEDTMERARFLQDGVSDAHAAMQNIVKSSLGRLLSMLEWSYEHSLVTSKQLAVFGQTQELVNQTKIGEKQILLRMKNLDDRLSLTSKA